MILALSGRASWFKTEPPWTSTIRHPMRQQVSFLSRGLHADSSAAAFDIPFRRKCVPDGTARAGPSAGQRRVTAEQRRVRSRQGVSGRHSEEHSDLNTARKNTATWTRQEEHSDMNTARRTQRHEHGEWNTATWRN